MRPAAALIALASVILAAGCGSGSGGRGESGNDTTIAAPPGTTLEALWRAPGEDVAVVAGTTDFQAGRNRISFLVVDKASRLIERPTARVWVARGLKQVPYATTTATLEPIGVAGGETADAGSIYVANVRTPKPGTYWFMAEPVGDEPIQALGNIVVRERSKAPSVGDRAIPSKTPTLASTGDDLTGLTTSRTPDRALYRKSVAEALAAHRPFVVTFATPQFCQTRTCGPVVDVLSAVRKRMSGRGVTFIHVEIYTDNDPAKGVNRWVDEWRLPSEPFTFVVDRTGVIRAKLEGAFGVGELEAAAKTVASS